MVVEIKNFNLSERPWRIDWLGRILFSGSRHEEPRIVVHLSELRDDYVDALSNGAFPDNGGHADIEVKVGC